MANDIAPNSKNLQFKWVVFRSPASRGRRVVASVLIQPSAPAAGHRLQKLNSHKLNNSACHYPTAPGLKRLGLFLMLSHRRLLNHQLSCITTPLPLATTNFDFPLHSAIRPLGQHCSLDSFKRGVLNEPPGCGSSGRQRSGHQDQLPPRLSPSRGCPFRPQLTN